MQFNTRNSADKETIRRYTL